MSTRRLRNLHDITLPKTAQQIQDDWQAWERRKHLLDQVQTWKGPEPILYPRHEVSRRLVAPNPTRAVRSRRVLPMSIPVSGEKQVLWAQQHGKCFYCEGPLLPVYHVDHIHPRSKGGANHIDNYCLACAHCNLSKNNKSAVDFLSYLLEKRAR